MSRAMRMPYQAVVRCGGLSAQLAIERVLWQKVQFTPSDWLMCTIRPNVPSVARMPVVLLAGPVTGSAVVLLARMFLSPSR